MDGAAGLTLLQDKLPLGRNALISALVSDYQRLVLEGPRPLRRQRHAEFERMLIKHRALIEAQKVSLSVIYASINRCIKAEQLSSIRENVKHIGYPRIDRSQVEQLYGKLAHPLSEPPEISELVEHMVMSDDYTRMDYHRCRYLLRFLLRQKDLKMHQFKLLQGFYELCEKIDTRRQRPKNNTLSRFIEYLRPESSLGKKLEQVAEINRKAQKRARYVKRLTMFLISITVIEPTTMLAEAISGVFLSSAHAIAYLAYFSTLALGIIFAFILIKATFNMCEDALMNVYRNQFAEPYFHIEKKPIEASDYYYSKFIYTALAVIESLALLLFVNNSLQLFAGKGLMAMGPTVWITVLAITGVEAVGLVLTMMVTDIYPIMGYFRQKDYENSLQTRLSEPTFSFGNEPALMTHQWSIRKSEHPKLEHEPTLRPAFAANTH